MDPLNPSSSRTDRKTIERNRRNEMKGLYSKLNSLVPHHFKKEGTSLPDQLDEATSYIKKLQVSLEKMREKKNSLMGLEAGKSRSIDDEGLPETGSLPVETRRIEIHDLGSAVEVVLMTGPDCQFMFNETIRILHEEGAEIVNASFSLVNDHTVFHTIHCKVGEFARATRLSERLKKFVEDNIGS